MPASNAALLLHQRLPGTRVVALTAIVPGGAREDAPERAGRTAMTMRLLGRGTKRRSADDFSERIEGLGASLSFAADQDFATATMLCLAEDAKEVAPLLGEALFESTFPWDEIDSERAKHLAALRAQEDQTSSVALRKLREIVFAPHPYMRPQDGLPGGVQALVQTELVLRAQELGDTSKLILSFSGDLDEATASRLAERILASAPPPPPPRMEANPSLSPRGGRQIVSKPLQQGFVAVGFLTCGAKDPDRAALTVAATILGGGMSARLFTELRDRRGLAYAVGAANAFHQQTGMCYAYIGTKKESLEEAADGLWTEARRLRDEPIREEELSRAQNYYVGNFLRDLETPRARAARRAYDAALGLDPDFGERWPAAIRAVTLRDVLRVANRYFLDPVTVLVHPQ